jgi:hypothetical protein
MAITDRAATGIPGIGREVDHAQNFVEDRLDRDGVGDAACGLDAGNGGDLDTGAL